MEEKKLEPCKKCGEIPKTESREIRIIDIVCECGNSITSHGPDLDEAISEWNEAQKNLGENGKKYICTDKTAICPIAEHKRCNRCEHGLQLFDKDEIYKINKIETKLLLENIQFELNEVMDKWIKLLS